MSAEKHVARAIILNEKEEVLLNKRASGYLGGKWEVPGGLIEEGEDPRDAAIREVFEETGLIFDAKALFKKDTQKPYESVFNWHIYYYSGSATGELKLDPKEVSEAKFVSPDTLKDYDFAFERLRENIEEFYQKRGQEKIIFQNPPQGN